MGKVRQEMSSTNSHICSRSISRRGIFLYPLPTSAHSVDVQARFGLTFAKSAWPTAPFTSSPLAPAMIVWPVYAKTMTFPVPMLPALNVPT